MKHLLIILSILLLSSPLFGQSTPKYENVFQCVLQTMQERKLTGNEMFGVVKKGCERILGKVENGVENKQGEVLFGRKVNGKLVWFERSKRNVLEVKYEGQIRNKLPNGFGKSNFEGNVYEGDWLNGKYHGKGTYTFKSGDKYVGEWKNGQRHGKGTRTNDDGSKAVGEWRDNLEWNTRSYGKKGNEVIVIWENGTMVCIFDGNSSLSIPSCNNFLGKVENEIGKGNSVLYWVLEKWKDNGDEKTNGKYVGKIKNGKPDGHGTYYYEGFVVYEGEWKDGKKHGQGTQIEPSRKIVGEFKEGMWWNVSVYDNNGNFQFKYVDEER